MYHMNMDLRKYLQQNHIQLTWKERIKIVNLIIHSLYFIHKDNAIHRDLHSGNILYSYSNQIWYISDLGFCGPADKPSKSIYGNLPYIAPEVISGKGHTFKSDIYSVGILMWEISSGKPPYSDHDHDFDLTMKIINGIRPEIVPGTPLKYKQLMEQCWDANPSNRPDGSTLIEELRTLLSCQNELENENNVQSQTSLSTNPDNSQIKNTTSKLYIFLDVPKPKNASESKILVNFLFYLNDFILLICFFFFNPYSGSGRYIG